MACACMKEEGGEPSPYLVAGAEGEGKAVKNPFLHGIGHGENQKEHGNIQDNKRPGEGVLFHSIIMNLVIKMHWMDINHRNALIR
jgi:hypothetical protein